MTRLLGRLAGIAGKGVARARGSSRAINVLSKGQQTRMLTNLPAMGAGGLFLMDAMGTTPFEMVGGPIRGLKGAAYEEPGGVGVARRTAKAEVESMVRGMYKQAELEELRKRMERAAVMIAAMQPQLYNEALAGRKLPKGARVFGGNPRVDLLQQLAMATAQGQFTAM